MPPRLVITHWVHPEVVDLLGRSFEVIPNITRETLPRAEVLRRAREAEALMIFMPDIIDRPFVQSCPRLKIIAGAFKGYDNVDVGSCTEHGIWVTIVHDLLTAPTADLAVGLLIGLTRNIAQGDHIVRSGRFTGWRPLLYGAGLAGKTVGIMGMGAVGQAIAKRLRGFDVTILYTDPVKKDGGTGKALTPVSLDELLEQSDHIILSAPLTPATFHLVDRNRLAQMKPGAYLVNISRGSIVDEQAVTESLEAGHLAGYAADVFEMEDLSRRDRPLAIPELLLQTHRRTLFTPHLGSAVDEVRRAIALEAAANIFEALGGKRPKGAINEPRTNLRLQPLRPVQKMSST